MIGVVATNEIDKARHFAADHLEIHFQFWIEERPVRRGVIELDRLRRIGDGMQNHARLHSQAANIVKFDVAPRIFSDDFKLVSVLQIDSN